MTEAPGRPGQERTSSAMAVLTVFEFVGGAESRTLVEIIEQIGRPKSTVLRLLDTLVQSGFVHRTAPGRYAVTLKAWRIGSRAMNYESLRKKLVPVLRRVASETQECALYAVYETGGYGIYIEKVDSPQPVSTSAAIGSRAPVHATATGKALLAHQPDDEIERVIAAARPCSPATITDPQALREQLAAVRETGVAFTRGEWRHEVAGAAAPVFDHGGAVLGSVGISCPLARVEGHLEELGAIVCAVSSELSDTFGAPDSVLAPSRGNRARER